jgi:hypothetical protein
MTYSTQNLIEASLKRELSTEELTLLPYILEVVDGYIDDIVGGPFGTVLPSTRYYDGGTQIVDIDTCVDVTSVQAVDSLENVISDYTIGTQFELRPRNLEYKKYIEFRNFKFPKGVANIAVTGKFTESLTVPKDIEYLATYLVSQLFSSEVIENLKSESIEGYSRTFGGLIEDNQVVKMIVDKYSKDDVLI